MPSAYLQWRFHSGERVVARGPLVSFTVDSIWSKMLSIKILYFTTENKIYDKKIVVKVIGFLQKKTPKKLQNDQKRNLGRASFGG